MRAALVLAALMVGGPASAQPKEEPVPEGVFGVAEIRAFVSSPLWFAWKLPSSSLSLATSEAPRARAPLRDSSSCSMAREARRKADPGRPGGAEAGGWLWALPGGWAERTMPC